MNHLQDLYRARVDRATQDIAQYAPLANARGPDAAEDYSFLRAINTLKDDPHAGTNGSRSTTELRASLRESEKFGPPSPGCLRVPMQRDASVAGTGAFLVATENTSNMFVPGLRANSVAALLGVNEIQMEHGNATIPRTVTDIATYYLAAETTQVTEGDLTFGQHSITPKVAAAYIEMSRLLTLQAGASGEKIIVSEITKAVAAKKDIGLIQGSGSSGEPQGIVGTSGVGSVSGATLTWAKVCEAIASVEDANATVDPTRTGWAVASDAAEILRKREKATGLGFIMESGLIDGRPVVVSNSVPSGTAIYADWSTVLLPTWSLEIGVATSDPSAQLFRRGALGLRCLLTFDVLVTRPASICKIVSIS